MGGLLHVIWQGSFASLLTPCNHRGNIFGERNEKPGASSLAWSRHRFLADRVKTTRHEQVKEAVRTIRPSADRMLIRRGQAGIRIFPPRLRNNILINKHGISPRSRSAKWSVSNCLKRLSKGDSLPGITANTRISIHSRPFLLLDPAGHVFVGIVLSERVLVGLVKLSMQVSGRANTSVSAYHRCIPVCCRA